MQGLSGLLKERGCNSYLLMHYWVNTRVEKKGRVQLKNTRNGAMFGDV